MGLDVNGRWEAVLSLARSLDPDAYLLTGDFCAHDPEASIYERLYPQLQSLGKPYYVVPGNHDDRALMRQHFPSLGGHNWEPIYNLAEIGGYSFIFLDSSTGTVDSTQLDWLQQTLPQSPRATIVIHHPPVPLGINFMDGKHPLRDTDRLLDLLTSDGQRRRIFCGHYHNMCTVSHRNLDIFLCPPTSFYIDARAADFQLVNHRPGFNVLEWTDGGDFRCTPYATSAPADELQN